MNTELQELRRHYQNLDAHVKSRKTAQSLLRAIQIAEASQEVVEAAREFYNEADSCSTMADRLHDALARVTKEWE